MSEKDPGTNRVAGEELRGYIERLERLDAAKADLSADQKVVYAEAKSDGYSPRYMKAILKLRKKSPSEREEDIAMMELYSAALGMSSEAPLFRHVESMGVDVAAEEKVIEALKLLAPMDGEITIKVGKAPRMRLARTKEGVTVEEVPDTPTPQPRSEPAPEAKKGRPGQDAPDCTESEAFELGKQARRDDLAIIKNPFAWDDKRRRKWDEGWREEDGGDGMG